MIQSPCGAENQSTKTCWTCEEKTSYSLGFCETCWAAIPEKIKSAYCLAQEEGSPWAEQFNIAVADGLRRIRRPPPRASMEISLDDLDLGNL